MSGPAAPLPEVIDSFQGEWGWLSNFWPAEVHYSGERYPTVEHAYQAAKLKDPQDRWKVRDAPTPEMAKRLGRRLRVRPDWTERKVEVMRLLLRQKFTPEGELAKQLLATGEALLVEGNTWGDRFWGQCPVGVGENRLGQLLMRIRAELRWVKR